MKTFILFITAICFTQIVSAQVKVTDLAELPLKGHVKQVVEYTFHDSDKLAEKRILKFDVNGNQTEQLIFDGNGNMSFKILYSYPSNNIVITNQFDANGKLFLKCIYKYDDNGREIESDPDYGSNIQSAVSKFTFKYDRDGNRIEEDTYNTENKISQKNILLYNNKNQEIELDSKGFLNNESKFTYDSLGNQIKLETYNTDGAVNGGSVFSYSDVDNNGNWLLSTSETKGHSQWQGDYTFKNVIKRNIEYY